MALMSLDEVRGELFPGPSIYPHDLDFARAALLFVRMHPGAYSAASFLDQRIFTADSQGRWVRFEEMDGWFAAPPPPRPLHFIFHAGHVGSTLISRLLESAGGVLSLREPLPLRTLAHAYDTLNTPTPLAAPDTLEALLDRVLILWQRGYADTRAVIVKATSSAGRLAPTLLAARPEARALYLNLAAEPYLATLLAGENTPQDLAGHGPERLQRLARFTGATPAPLHAMSLGEVAAMTWAVEKLTEAQARRALGPRFLSVDFDAFLTAPGAALRAICAHFGLAAPDSLFENIAGNPVLTRYSKAPEHPYTPAFRQQVLAASRARQGAEISRGLKWLEDFARRFPAAAPLLA